MTNGPITLIFSSYGRRDVDISLEQLADLGRALCENVEAAARLLGHRVLADVHLAGARQGSLHVDLTVSLTFLGGESLLDVPWTVVQIWRALFGRGGFFESDGPVAEGSKDIRDLRRALMKAMINDKTRRFENTIVRTRKIIAGMGAATVSICISDETSELWQVDRGGDKPSLPEPDQALLRSRTEPATGTIRRTSRRPLLGRTQTHEVVVFAALCDLDERAGDRSFIAAIVWPTSIGDYPPIGALTRVGLDHIEAIDVVLRESVTLSLDEATQVFIASRPR